MCNAFHGKTAKLFLPAPLIFAFCLPILSSQRENGALLIAACIVAAIRLRGEPIRPSPKLTATVQDSVELAKMVLREVRIRDARLYPRGASLRTADCIALCIRRKATV